MVKAHILKMFGNRFLIEIEAPPVAEAIKKRFEEGQTDIDVSIRTLG